MSRFLAGPKLTLLHADSNNSLDKEEEKIPKEKIKF